MIKCTEQLMHIKFKYLIFTLHRKCKHYCLPLKRFCDISILSFISYTILIQVSNSHAFLSSNRLFICQNTVKNCANFPCNLHFAVSLHIWNDYEYIHSFIFFWKTLCPASKEMYTLKLFLISIIKQYLVMVTTRI